MKGCDTMYMPILIEMKESRVVIIGGGKVALRRAEKFLKYGAKITIVSPNLETSFDIHENIVWIKDYYKKHYLLEADFVVAATNDREVNDLISMDCKELKCLCNRVDQGNTSEVIVPMCIQQGDLSIAVSTNGQSPLYAKQLVKKIGDLLEPEIEEKLELLGKLREKILASGYLDSEKKHELLEKMIDMNASSLRVMLEDLK